MSMSTEKRSFVRLPREQRMREIEAAARKVFAKHGFDAAAINEIAGEAGVSEGAIYKFYSSKRDLLHTILRAWYLGMIEEFIAKLEGIEGTHARIHIVIWQHLKSIKENPDLVRLFYSEVRNAQEYFSTDLYEMNRAYTQVLMEILADGVERGELRDDVSMALVRDVIFGGIEHRVASYLYGRSNFDPDVVARQLSDMVFAGIATRPQETSDLGSLIERLERVANRLDKSPLRDG